MYPLIAAHYERDVTPIVSDLARALIESISADKLYGRILDVGTGTGIVARLITQHLTAHAHVVGLDNSPDMLRAAQVMPNVKYAVQYVLSDIQIAPFADHTFDLAIASFGLNMTQPRRTFREIRRLLRADGWLIFQEWAARDPLSEAFDVLFSKYVPESALDAIAEITPPSDWQDYLQDADDYRDLLGELGCTNITASEGTPVTVHLPTVHSLITYKQAWPPYQIALAAMDIPTRATFASALSDELAAFSEADGSLRWSPPLFRIAAQFAR